MAEQEQEDEQEQERDELERQMRTSKALQAMEKELQLPTAVVMPVLLRLIKTFDGNWEHIEDENYRLLADMIFQQQEAVEIEKAPGSSSGRKNGKKEKKAGQAIRTTPRRAPRNSKLVESDDSDENDRGQELVRRSRRVSADARAQAARLATPIAKRKPPSTALHASDDNDPAWEPLFALGPVLRSAPQHCQELQSGGARRELRRISTGQPVREEVTTADKQTQTEDIGLQEAHHESIRPMAIVTQPVPQPLAIVKQENAATAVFLPAAEVRRQILNHVAPSVPVPCKALSGDLCNKCEKPRPVSFDPSKVKLEPQGAPKRPRAAPLGCLNPEPLQAVVPSSPPPPLALALIETPAEHFEAMEPEPLLLTFPSKAPDEVAEIAPQVQVLVPCSVTPVVEEAVQVDANAGTSLEQKEAPPEPIPVENPLMKVKVELELTSKVEVKVLKIAESSKTSLPKVEELQQPNGAGFDNCNSGALAALASYISESDNEDPNMSPKLESSERRTSPPVEGVEQGKSEHEAPGILPLANTSSVAVLADASSKAENFPGTSRDSWAIVEVKQDNTLPTQDSEMITLNVINPNAATQPAADSKEERKQSASDGTSSDSSKKRKRTLLKKHQQEREELAHIEAVKAKQRYDREDISRGKEKVPISLSAPGGQDLPKDFFYVNSSVVFQSAHVGISMARIGEDDRCSTCVGNCLDNRIPCECARLTDGEYAYTVEGFLYPHFLKQELERKQNLNFLSFCQPGACPVERTSDETCKGHIQRRFIKECWEKCGCTQLCGNRIVQRGIVHRLQVFWTEGGKGWGVRTLEHLSAGTFVCEYAGEILTNTEMWYRNNDIHRTAKHHFSLQLDADWCSEQILKDEEALCLDGTYYGNVARFINHRCVDTNLLEVPVEIESPDHHYYHLAFFTSKDINVNEELTWDYGLDFNDKDHPLQAFECFCGSPFCRGKMEGKPWV